MATAAVVLAIGLAPLGVGAADHLDAPTVSANGATDITDVYAYSTNDSTKTVLIANVNPGAGALPNSTTSFGTGVQYNITVDTNGNASPDITYLIRFSAGNPQGVTIWKNGKLWGAGTTGKPIVLKGGTKLWAGLRDDPFFFDLDAFKGSILGAANGRMLCDAGKVDFFLGLNVSAIVLLLPNAELGGNGKTVGVSANTAVQKGGQWVQVDQMGRPGISTVFNNSLVAGAASVNSVKELFNRAQPVEQTSLGFKANVIATLKAVSTAFAHPYTDAEASGLADVLVPDLLTYKTGDKTGFLNGRRLTDDVIDTLLAVGANTPGASDCIGNDSTFSGSFPYLGAPNSGVSPGSQPGLGPRCLPFQLGCRSRRQGVVPNKRFMFLPIVAVAIALLSYGLGAFNGAMAPPTGPVAAAIHDPLTEPGLPVDATAIGVAGPSDTDSRIAFWQARIKSNPSSDVQYQYLGELLSLKGRETGDISQYALATEAFEKATDLFPGNVAARQGLAITLVTLHEWADAIDQATVILQDDVRAIGAVAVIGDASLEVGDLDTAEAAFQTLREKASSPSVESRFARLAFLTGETDEAIQILEDAAQAAADLNRSGEEQAFYRYSAGEYRLSKGDIDGAGRAFEAALGRFPNYYLALAGRGRVAFARGNLAEAIESYRAAVAIIPKPELLAYLGDLYAVSGDLVAAEKQYKAVDFIATLNEIQADVFNRELALFQATHHRDTAHAVTIATAELEVRKDIYGYDALAWALFNDGHVEQALDPAQRALSLGTQDPRLLYHLGMIELANGRAVDGEGHLREAIALNPAFDPLGAEAAREALGD